MFVCMHFFFFAFHDAISYWNTLLACSGQLPWFCPLTAPHCHDNRSSVTATFLALYSTSQHTERSVYYWHCFSLQANHTRYSKGKISSFPAEMRTLPFLGAAIIISWWSPVGTGVSTCCNCTTGARCILLSLSFPSQLYNNWLLQCHKN